jgi:hypothetical protein
MQRGAVYSPHDSFQLGTKGAVAFAAAESSLMGKFLESQTAVGASDIHGRLGFLRELLLNYARENLRQRKRDIIQRGMKSSLGGAVFTQRENHLLVVDNLCQVNCRLLFLTILANHSNYLFFGDLMHEAIL